MEPSFKIVSIALYQTDQDLLERGASAEALDRYIKKIDAAASAVLNRDLVPQGVSGALVLGIKPGAKSRLWIVLGDDRRKSVLMILLKAEIEAIAAPSVKQPIALAIHFDAWGGGHRVAVGAVPSEWAEASRKAGRALAVPDEIFASLWPDDVLQSLEASLAEDLRRRDANAAADRIEKIIELTHPDDRKARFEARRKRGEQFYLEGQGKGVDFSFEVALAIARRATTMAQGPNERWTALINLGATAAAFGVFKGERKRFEEAVAAYRKALKECARERRPALWAETKRRLGFALSGLGMHETTCLEEAVVVLREALTEFTRERSPLNWAETQMSLGVALRLLGERENETTRLADAIAAHREALKEYTREKTPFDWAKTQNDLGNALRALGEREKTTARLDEAVAAQREALKEFNRERDPDLWARAQADLGGALLRVGECRENESRTACFEEAVAAFREALEELTRERVPFEWASAQNNLGLALSLCAKRAAGTAHLEEAIAAYHEALKEWTHERAPIQWAIAAGFQGDALFRLALHRRDRTMAETAVQQIEAALRVAREHADMLHVAIFEKSWNEKHAFLRNLKPC